MYLIIEIKSGLVYSENDMFTADIAKFKVYRQEPHVADGETVTRLETYVSEQHEKLSNVYRECTAKSNFILEEQMRLVDWHRQHCQHRWTEDADGIMYCSQCTAVAWPNLKF